ncbi:hypothetical protein ACFX2C_007049 [Malus domestica]
MAQRLFARTRHVESLILLDHRRFVGLFQQHLPSSSGVAPRSEAPTDQPPIPPPSVAPPTAETPPTTATSPKQPL